MKKYQLFEITRVEYNDDVDFSGLGYLLKTENRDNKLYFYYGFKTIHNIVYTVKSKLFNAILNHFCEANDGTYLDIYGNLEWDYMFDSMNKIFHVCVLKDTDNNSIECYIYNGDTADNSTFAHFNSNKLFKMWLFFISMK